jgi:hypothetical protein
LLLVFGLETEFAEVGIRNGAAELVVTLAAIQRALDVLPQGPALVIITFAPVESLADRIVPL